MQFLFAIIAGFVAGMAGAMVAFTIRAGELEKTIDDVVQSQVRIQADIREHKTFLIAVQQHIETLNIAIKREHAGVWEGINNVYGYIDRLHAEPEPVPEPEPEPEKKPKRKAETKNAKS